MPFTRIHFHFASAAGDVIERNIPLPVLRGLVLRAIEAVDPDLARSLHDGSGVPSYAVQHRVDGANVHVMLNSFSPDLDRALRRFLVSASSAAFILGRVSVTLLKVHADMVEPGMLIDDAQPVDRFTIIFKTPTFFKNASGLVVRFPDPSIMIKNVVRSWNELSGMDPVDLDTIAAWAGAHVEIIAHELRTGSVRLGSGNREQVGFKGWATFAIKNVEAADPLPRMIDILMRFAEYCNVGGGRTTGLGSVHYQRARVTGTDRTDMVVKKNAIASPGACINEKEGGKHHVT